MASINFFSGINLNKSEILNVVVQNLASAPSSPGNGQVYFDSTLNQFGCYSSGSWVYLSSPVANAVTKASNASASDVLQVSAGADRTLKDFASAGGLIKVSPSGVVSIAVPGTDYVVASGLTGYQLKSEKDQSGGYAGLTLLKINFRNVANTFTSFFTNTNSASRTYSFQDRDGTIADNTDITDAKNRANHTGTQLASTISDFFAQVRATLLTGLSTATATVITASDSVLSALGKLQAQITGYASSTKTFTNTTFDANGTGNSLINVETGDFAAGVIVTTVSGSSTDSQIPTAKAVNTLVSNAVVGLFNDRGAYDASVNAFPSSGGSGVSGAIKKGDIWTVSVSGIMPGSQAVVPGDTIRAMVDTPGTTPSNWTIAEANDTQATTSTMGLVKLATNAESLAQTVTDKAVTPAGLVGYGRIKEFTIGDGTTTNIVVTDSFPIQKMAIVRDSSTNTQVYVDIVYAANTTTFKFDLAPSTGAYKVVVIG